ncbi:MAG: hypothetical protein QNJ36_03430 [Calothrix sp. MO_167.B42]|nr:hypothetical protein [Calothrix sp. MO_167.B42]
MPMKQESSRLQFLRAIKKIYKGLITATGIGHLGAYNKHEAFCLMLNKWADYSIGESPG